MTTAENLLELDMGLRVTLKRANSESIYNETSANLITNFWGFPDGSAIVLRGFTFRLANASESVDFLGRKTL